MENMEKMETEALPQTEEVKYHLLNSDFGYAMVSIFMVYVTMLAVFLG